VPKQWKESHHFGERQKEGENNLATRGQSLDKQKKQPGCGRLENGRTEIKKAEQGPARIQKEPLSTRKMEGKKGRSTLKNKGEV